MTNKKKQIKINVGCGSVYRRKDGTLAWRYRKNGYDQTIYAKTKIELEVKAKEFLEIIQHGPQIKKRNMTLSDLIYEDLTEIRDDLAESTTELYLQLNRDYIEDSSIDLLLDKLSYSKIQKFINSLKSKCSYSIIRRIRGILYASLTYAKTEHLIHENPCDGVTLPKEDKCKGYEEKQIVYLNSDEMDKFYEILQSDNEIDVRLKTLIITLLYSGCRIGEALALKWNFVDFENNQLNIVNNLRRVRNNEKKKTGKKDKQGKTRLRIGLLKSKTSRRVIPVPEKLMTSLRELKQEQDQYIAENKDSYQSQKLVFATQLGGLVDPRNERRRFKKYLKKINFRNDINFHSLRHSYASKILLSYPTKLASELLGHSSTDVTTKIYHHICSSDKRDAVNTL